ncbi:MULTISPECIES: hypothetical protein [Pseudonocardia]|uniref:hypothetical protein n=1 Tax=Pseudonocardia TaxID=1847 RepID=UPI001CEC88FF|nr:hypothetical protein [Pseudonocardia abyssalis]
MRTSAGDVVSARFLVTGMGLLASAPYTPDIPGLDTFSGECHHTGRRRTSPWTSRAGGSG